MTEIDKLAWLCVKDKHLLVVRSKGARLFYIPGGKREVGESDQAALCREINEELCVDIVPETVQYACTFIAQADAKESGLQVKLTCYHGDFSGELRADADAEVEKLEWFASQDSYKCSKVSQMVMSWCLEKGLIE